MSSKLNIRTGDTVMVITGDEMKEGTIHVSNVMLVCPNCKKPTRVGHTFIEKDGKKVKVRVCKRKACGKIID